VSPEPNIRTYVQGLAEKEALISAALTASAPIPTPTNFPGPSPPNTPGGGADGVAATPSARSGTAGAHLFFGAVGLIFGCVLARGGHR
jgi:hypothetical protein